MVDKVDSISQGVKYYSGTHDYYHNGYTVVCGPYESVMEILPHDSDPNSAHFLGSQDGQHAWAAIRKPPTQQQKQPLELQRVSSSSSGSPVPGSPVVNPVHSIV